jgi:hypothetical protein
MQSQSPETTLPCSTIIHRGRNSFDFTMKLWDPVDIIAADTYLTFVLHMAGYWWAAPPDIVWTD